MEHQEHQTMVGRRKEGEMTLLFSKKSQTDWLLPAASPPSRVRGRVDTVLPYDLATVEASHRTHDSLICVRDSAARSVVENREK